MGNLLIEIGVEEIPAVAFLKEYPNIEKKYSDILKKYSLYSDFEFFYTPRRLVLIHKNFKKSQKDSFKEIFGPPLSISYNNDTPTKAALGFAKKCNIDIKDIKKATKNGQDVLYFRQKIEGKKSKDLLKNIIDDFITSLSFGKNMRWDGEYKFIRPIRWITVIFDNDVINFNSFGINSSSITYPHRSISYEYVKIKNMQDYLEKIESLGVILDQNRREKIILDKFDDLQKKYNITINLDKELLEHIVAITENPNPILGYFDKEFLELPKEVIASSLKEHQKYFTVYKNGKITNMFVVVSNSLSKNSDTILNGNQKVLKARLKDAMFFFLNDKKRGLNSDGLRDITFVDSLGSLKDKLNRERQIAVYLAKIFNEDLDDINEAIDILKADLLSEMVYEFTHLQGIMGYYYALLENRSKKIATSIKEQYYPIGKNGKLPSSIFSSIIAISNKLDNIISLFSINKIPSGTKDPFALRRDAIGIIKIAIFYNLSFDLITILDKLENNYKKIDTKAIDEFFCERLYQIFDVNPSIITAVLKNPNRDFSDISNRIELINQVSKKSNFKEYVSTFKRVSNIIKDIDMKNIDIDQNLLNSKYEKELYDDIFKIKNANIKSHKERLDKLLLLKEPLDNFFNNIMVNDKNDKLKTNRKNLMANIYIEFLKVADIKDISI